MEENPSHTYLLPGNYTVTLTASNECGTASFEMTILAGDLPVAGFTAESPGGCVPHTVQFNNQSTGNYTQLLWSFPGGNPAVSTDENPIVTYDAVGSYEASLNIDGPLGSNELTQEAFVEVLPIPIP